MLLGRSGFYLGSIMIGFVVGMVFVCTVMFFLISFLSKDERMTIEGIPEGWELMRIGSVRHGEFHLDGKGHPVKWNSAVTSEYANYAIVRKIEKPKRYRAFENAAEFEPHRDRWIRRTYNGDLSHAGCFKGHAYDDEGIYDLGAHFTFQEMFDDGRQFDDGTPFGIEVTE